MDGWGRRRPSSPSTGLAPPARRHAGMPVLTVAPSRSATPTPAPGRRRGRRPGLPVRRRWQRSPSPPPRPVDLACRCVVGGNGHRPRLSTPASGIGRGGDRPGPGRPRHGCSPASGRCRGRGPGGGRVGGRDRGGRPVRLRIRRGDDAVPPRRAAGARLRGRTRPPPCAGGEVLGRVGSDRPGWRAVCPGPPVRPGNRTRTRTRTRTRRGRGRVGGRGVVAGSCAWGVVSGG